jgi:hypothetical protein
MRRKLPTSGKRDRTRSGKGRAGRTPAAGARTVQPPARQPNLDAERISQGAVGMAPLRARIGGPILEAEEAEEISLDIDPEGRTVAGIHKNVLSQGGPIPERSGVTGERMGSLLSRTQAMVSLEGSTAGAKQQVAQNQRIVRQAMRASRERLMREIHAVIRQGGPRGQAVKDAARELLGFEAEDQAVLAAKLAAAREAAAAAEKAVTKEKKKTHLARTAAALKSGKPVSAADLEEALRTYEELGGAEDDRRDTTR